MTQMQVSYFFIFIIGTLISLSDLYILSKNSKNETHLSNHFSNERVWFANDSEQDITESLELLNDRIDTNFVNVSEEFISTNIFSSEQELTEPTFASTNNETNFSLFSEENNNTTQLYTNFTYVDENMTTNFRHDYEPITKSFLATIDYSDNFSETDWNLNESLNVTDYITDTILGYRNNNRNFNKSQENSANVTDIDYEIISTHSYFDDELNVSTTFDEQFNNTTEENKTHIYFEKVTPKHQYISLCHPTTLVTTENASEEYFTVTSQTDSKLINEDTNPLQSREQLKTVNNGFATTTNDSLILTLLNTDGLPCLRMVPEIMIAVYYRKKDPSGKGAAFFPRLPRKPNDIFVEGNCEYQNEALLKMSWDKYILSWKFSRTWNMTWYISDLEFLVYTKHTWFRNHDICVPSGDPFQFSAQLKNPSVPLEQSFIPCKEISISFVYNEKLYDSVRTTLSAFIYLKKEFQVQPFMNNTLTFGPSNECY